VTTKYETAVAEARQLVTRSEEDQWRLAELTWQQVEGGKSRQQWAKDLGIPRTRADRWYRVWAGVQNAQWSPATHTYTEAYDEVQGRAEQIEEYGTRSAAEAHRAVRNMPPERKAEIVREALEDEDVAQAVVEHPETMRAVNRAVSRTDTGKQVAREVKAHEAREEETGPQPVTPLQVLPMFLDHAAELREFIGRATVDGVTADALPMIEGLAKHLIATGEQALAITAGAPVKVTDDDIQTWLNGNVR